MILAIETSCRGGGAALADQGEIVGEITLAVQRTYSKQLLPSIHWLLEHAGVKLNEIEAVAVGLGPGSFTGLRIGVSTAKGLAFATGAELVGISSLDALAAALLPSPSPITAFPLVDARKGQVYTAQYLLEGNELERVSPYLSLSPSELPSSLDTAASGAVLMGDGLDKYGAEITALFAPGHSVAPRHTWFPRPALVALLAEGLLSSGVRHDIASLSPIYVRPSDAETGGKVRRFQEAGAERLRLRLP